MAGRSDAGATAAASRRLRATMGHLGLSAAPASASSSASSSSGKAGEREKKKIERDLSTRAFPPARTSVLKWNGWGYTDSGFTLNQATGHVEFHGARYELDGLELQGLRPFMEDKVGLDLTKVSPSQVSVRGLSAPRRNDAFLRAIKGLCQLSFEAADRVFHSHGHTCDEIFALRHGRVGRCVDAVAWPENHDQVEKLVGLCASHNVCLIPFGGGTTVTGAVEVPEAEGRMVVSADTSKMNRILWVDKRNMTARVQAGVVGSELERALAEVGVCTGHEPDSQEFSTVGGWVSTRASGMKKNVYGNIEDIVTSIRIVTPRGTVEKNCAVPRISSGPDIHEMFLGSEGTLGLVTEVTMNVHHLPETTEYDSVVFPTFELGIKFMRAVAEAKCAPASVRLVDNEQFQFGQALKPSTHGVFASAVDALKTFYVTRIKGFEKEKLCAATLLFQGGKEEVARQQAKVFELATAHGGLRGGAENGRRGYQLTFVIAYLRDLGMQYKCISESFETSVPWNCVEDLCRNTKDCVVKECARLGVQHEPFVSCRVTQTYHSGACVYFYYGFVYEGLDDPLGAFHAVEIAARDEVIANGGSISHHHGVGKVRKRWLEQTVTEVGVDMIRAVKERVDPENVFGNNNLLP